MTGTSNQPHDAVSLLERLSIPELESRLEHIRAEESAIRTLLRSLRARESFKRKSQEVTK